MAFLNSSEAITPENVTSEFIDEKFRNQSGAFDVKKAEAFEQELLVRRKEMQQQVHDTRYSERILRDVLSHRDALKNAHKKSTFSIGNVLRGFDIAVLPGARSLVEMIREEKPDEEIQQAAEAFVRAYSPFELPVCL